MLAEFFIVGGIWFWLLTSIVIIALIWETSCERPGLAIATMIVYCALIHFFGDASFFSTIKAHPEIIYIGLPVYFLTGAIWGIVKWALYVKRKSITYKEARLTFLNRKKIHGATLDTVIPDHLRSEWQNEWAPRYEGKPMVRNNKGKVLMWMGFWPMSMLWAVVDEPWRYIYDAIHSMLQRISDKVYADIGFDGDMEKMPKSPEENKKKFMRDE